MGVNPRAGAASPSSSDRTALVTELLALCRQPPAERSARDLRFIRDRLHELSAFFKLWPPKLQRLVCQSAQSKALVKGEVFFSAGDVPEHLFFLVDGQASICVRHANEAGRLKAMATLAAGDTFGEAALMGVPRQPAFVRVETGTAAALAVDAGQLAALMQGLQQHQLPADSRPQQQQQQQGPALHLAEEPGSRH